MLLRSIYIVQTLREVSFTGDLRDGVTFGSNGRMV